MEELIKRLGPCALAILILSVSGCVPSTTRLRSKVSARCTPPPMEIIGVIESSMAAKGFANHLRGSSAIKSKSEDVYFLAGDVEGPGFEGEGHTAVWASPQLSPEAQLFSVDFMARTFSDLPPSDQANSPVASDHEGAVDSRICVTGKLLLETPIPVPNSPNSDRRSS